jgi:hypothetical protein
MIDILNYTSVIRYEVSPIHSIHTNPFEFYTISSCKHFSYPLILLPHSQVRMLFFLPENFFRGFCKFWYNFKCGACIMEKHPSQEQNHYAQPF